MSTDETIDLFLQSMPSGADPRDTVRGELPQETLPGLPPIAVADAGVELGEERAHLVLGQTLGQGGMGVVRLATQPHLDREVAVKQLRGEAARTTATALVHEARVMGGLDHPNVIPVHALGVDTDGQPVLVMKRVDGVTWQRLLDEPEHARWQARMASGDDALSRNVAVLLEICRAVAYAHRRGVLHRDIKPENAMVGQHGEAYLVDWGLAAPVGVAVARVVGSPAWLAPELLRPGAVLGPATDVFGLGACLHQLLTGEPRHTGGTLREVLEQALVCAPVDYGPEVPEELADLCNRATAVDPEARIPTVEAFVDGLLEWRRHRGSVQLRETADARLAEFRALLEDPEPDPVAVADAFAGARFGYQQALEAWAGNAPATEGLRSALRAMAEHALARGDLDNAAARIGELAGLGEETDGFEARLADARRARAEADQLVRDQDFGVAPWQRVGLFGAIALFGFLVVAVVAQMDVEAVTHAELLGFGIAINVVTWAVIFALRDKLLRNAINRSVAAMLATVIATVLVHRAVGWARPEAHTVPELLAEDMLLIGFTGTMATIAISRRMWPLGPLFIAGGVYGHFAPQWAPHLIAVLSAVAPLLVVLLMLQDRVQGRRGL